MLSWEQCRNIRDKCDTCGGWFHYLVFTHLCGIAIVCRIIIVAEYALVCSFYRIRR